ncbi:MAG: TIR domain-containing protein [Planctomyces sp.]
MKLKAKPKIFIGSSTAALPIVDLFVTSLSEVASCIPWKQAKQFNCEGTNTTIGALQSASLKYDFALFILTPEDELAMSIRGKRRRMLAFRDNVVFEVGLFLGSIGSRRVFVARQNTDRTFRTPSDLLGAAIQPFDYDKSDRDHSIASINAASGGFKESISKLGFLEFRLQVSDKWGWLYDPQRFEVLLDPVVLTQQQELFDGYDIAIVARVEKATVNFEDDLDVACSKPRAIPQNVSAMTFQVLKSDFPKAVKANRDRIQARLILVPPYVRLWQCKTLKDAQAKGCRVVETLSCNVNPKRPK